MTPLQYLRGPPRGRGPLVEDHCHRLWIGWCHPMLNWTVGRIGSVGSNLIWGIFNFSRFSACFSQSSCGYIVRIRLIQITQVIYVRSRKKLDGLSFVWCVAAMHQCESSVTEYCNLRHKITSCPYPKLANVTFVLLFQVKIFCEDIKHPSLYLPRIQTSKNDVWFEPEPPLSLRPLIFRRSP